MTMDSTKQYRQSLHQTKDWGMKDSCSIKSEGFFGLFAKLCAFVSTDFQVMFIWNRKVLTWFTTHLSAKMVARKLLFLVRCFEMECKTQLLHGSVRIHHEEERQDSFLLIFLGVSEVLWKNSVKALRHLQSLRIWNPNYYFFFNFTLSSKNKGSSVSEAEACHPFSTHTLNPPFKSSKSIFSRKFHMSTYADMYMYFFPSVQMQTYCKICMNFFKLSFH